MTVGERKQHADLAADFLSRWNQLLLAPPFIVQKEWCSDRNEDHGHQKQEQRRLLKPRNGWNADSQYDADHTYAPCSNMNAGGEGSQCEHRQRR
jgi:hypothetical protein